MGTESTDADGNTTRDIETLNSMKALWARSKDEISEDEYKEFYKHVSHDWTDPPRETIHMKAEGTFRVRGAAVHPVPRAPSICSARTVSAACSCTSRRVFIMDDCEALDAGVPALRQGAWSTRMDLSLKRVPGDPATGPPDSDHPPSPGPRRCLSTVKDMMTGNAERYRTFWDEFGRGGQGKACSATPRNREAILEVASFASTNDAEELTSLRQYVERMKDGQGAHLLHDRRLPDDDRELAAYGGFSGPRVTRCWS